MFVLKALILCAAYLAINCQHQGPTTTPVPILKQINKQNDDGSYSFGYEAADGSFKIETKYPNGDVAGKYGYVDANGKTREISYGASSKRGFEPQGTGIQVPPPTLHNNSPASALADGQEDDGQYREDPSIYEDPKYNGRTSSKANKQYHRYSMQATEAPQYEPQYQPKSAPSQFRSSPVYSQQTSLFKQSPQQFPDEDYRPQSQVYHQQPEFSYQGYTSQPSQNYQSNYQSQPAYQSNYQSQPAYQSQYQSQPAYQQARQVYQPQTASYNNQNYNPFFGHPATNFDPSTGSYTINFTG